MNHNLLNQHVKKFIDKTKKDPDKLKEDFKERIDHINFYQSYDKQKILKMKDDDIYEYLSGLWAMLLWGNKHYVVNKIIQDNGLDNLKQHLAELVWGNADIEKRWDNFRTNIKGMGPAMISEILCKTHPDKYMVWNRRAYVGLNYLEVENLPRYDYQLTGKIFKHICNVSMEIAKEMKKFRFQDTSLLAVDYFIWDELQVEDNLSKIHAEKPKKTDDKEIEIPAVQGVVAVSDKNQLERIKKHASGVKDLKDKLKIWDYEDVHSVHESLQFVNENINNLGLVPQGF